MKILLIVSLILSQVDPQTLAKCSTCSSRKSESDCITDELCIWNVSGDSKVKSCIPVPSPYCVKKNCAKTPGCAYVDNNCTVSQGCTSYNKTTTSDCQKISFDCISDGKKCQYAKECPQYTQTECNTTPSLNGRNCIWDSTTNKCNYQKCKDAGANYKTDSECQAYSPLCVTTGSGCIDFTECSKLQGTYSTCLQMTGSDGKCFYDKDTNCRKRKCNDAQYAYNTNEQCQNFLSGCMTNGNGCVEQTLCQNYSNKTSCNGGGTDGPCVFMKGKCQIFTSCYQASEDEVACQSNQSCFFKDGKCVQKTCALQDTCHNVPNFKGQPFQICLMINNKCTNVDPAVLNIDTCFKQSNQTYTWNQDTQRCESCQVRTTLQIQNNSTNVSLFESLLKFTIPLLIVY